MDEKLEIQTTIFSKDLSSRMTEDEFLNVLKFVAPGTSLRSAIDGALKSGKGALIVVENDNLPSVIDGGFRINTKFTPQKLVELTKMDGAIILSGDLKKINYANVLLTPDSKIVTKETGTRHKAAERTARQIKTLAIAISERRKEITLYYRSKKYRLIETGELLRKANENIQIIETQREIFDHNLEKLTRLELGDYFNLKLAINVIQRGMFVHKISEELKRFCIELGKEGMLIKVRLKEITFGVEKETDLILKDYTRDNFKKTKDLIKELDYDDILDDDVLCNILFYENVNSSGSFRGWRILSKTSLSDAEIADILKKSEKFSELLDEDSLILKDNLGDDRASKIRQEILNLKIHI